MALLNDLMKNNLLTTLAVGVGVAVLAPTVLPALVRLSKPILKMAIKGGYMLYSKGLETVAEIGEVVEDIVAEAQSELSGPAEPPLDSGGPSKTPVG